MRKIFFIPIVLVVFLASCQAIPPREVDFGSVPGGGGLPLAVGEARYAVTVSDLQSVASVLHFLPPRINFFDSDVSSSYLRGNFVTTGIKRGDPHDSSCLTGLSGGTPSCPSTYSVASGASSV